MGLRVEAERTCEAVVAYTLNTVSPRILCSDVALYLCDSCGIAVCEIHGSTCAECTQHFCLACGYVCAQAA